MARSSDVSLDGHGESQRAGKQRPDLWSKRRFWSLTLSRASVLPPIKDFGAEKFPPWLSEQVFSRKGLAVS